MSKWYEEYEPLDKPLKELSDQEFYDLSSAIYARTIYGANEIIKLENGKVLACIYDHKVVLKFINPILVNEDTDTSGRYNKGYANYIYDITSGWYESHSDKKVVADVVFGYVEPSRNYYTKVVNNVMSLDLTQGMKK